MSDETKTPQAEQWWVNSSGKIRYIIGAKRSGSIVFEEYCGWSFVNDCTDWNDWHHEPRCTSFDWTEPPAIDPGDGWELLPVGTVLQEGDEFESGGDWNKTCYPGTKNIKGWTYRRRKPPAEVWPKYFIHSDQTCRWYIKRISETNCQYVSCSGEHDSDEWTGYSDHLVDSGTWREVTEAEALARVKPAEPAAAESPDDWVETTDPEYVLRAAIDEVWYSVENIGSEWQQVYPSAGMKLGDSQYEKARCRRRDLPVKLTSFPDAFAAITTAMRAAKEEQTPQPKRTPVRLWVSADVRWGDRYIVSVKDGNPNPERHQEVKFDGSRFYVEGIE